MRGSVIFTLEHSVNDILANNIIMSHFEYLMPVFFLELVPEELRHLPLKEVRHQVIMPWGVPYVADDVIEGANQLINLSQDSENYEFIKVWSEETPENYFPSSDGARDGVGLLLIKQSFKPGRKLALICPGGGYSAVSMLNEGIHTAKILVEKEYAVATLKVYQNGGLAQGFHNVSVRFAASCSYMPPFLDRFDENGDETSFNGGTYTREKMIIV